MRSTIPPDIEQRHDCGQSRFDVERKGVLSIAVSSFRTWGAILLALLITGCERPTRVRIEGDAIPVFVLSGSGEVAIFTVYSPDYMTKAAEPDDENFALWRISATSGYFGGAYIGQLGRITYGVVPPGYTQQRPFVGAAPPLTGDGKYSYFVETTDAPGAGGYFEIRNSRASAASGSGPCFQTKNQKWINVPCPTAEP